MGWAGGEGEMLVPVEGCIGDAWAAVGDFREICSSANANYMCTNFLVCSDLLQHAFALNSAL